MQRFLGTRPWWAWVLAFTLGELVGFGGVAVVGLALAELAGGLDVATRVALAYVLAIGGGLFEGAVLAAFTWRPLHRLHPRVDRRRWIRNTAVAGALAWALGMLGPTLDELVGLSRSAQVALGVLAALAILPSIGVAQALALRGAVARPGRWVVANVLGWLCGLPWTFGLPALLPDDASSWALGATFVAAGLLMGATAGALTGLFLPGLSPRRAARALGRRGR